MKCLYFIIFLLFTLVVHGQNIIPPKCCDPMHMPLNGQCQQVTCRNDAECSEKYQPYCTKYKLGQSICRGLSGVCGCNGERSNIDKSPTGLNCPIDQKCDSNGKCGPIEQQPEKCTDPDTVLVNGQCQEIKCRNDAQCQPYQSYCTKYKLSQAICRGSSKVCACNGHRAVSVHPVNPDEFACNRPLNGNDKCKDGQVCFPNGLCGPPPHCAFVGETCHPQTNPCCDQDMFCHQRRFSSGLSCVRTALVREPCLGGIPCEYGSECINDKCSLRKGDGCDFNGAVCPYDTKCLHGSLKTGTNKKCA